MILSMSLVISGIATFLQCKKVGPFGAGLLIVQGTSFNFIGPIIGIGSAMVAAGTPVESVMAAIFGVVIAGSFIEMGVSRILPWVKMLITPLVTGIVVLLIGLTLIKEGLISMGGGYQAMCKQYLCQCRQPNHVVYSLGADHYIEPYPYYLGKKFCYFNCLNAVVMFWQALWVI